MDKIKSTDIRATRAQIKAAGGEIVATHRRGDVIDQLWRLPDGSLWLCGVTTSRDTMAWRVQSDGISEWVAPQLLRARLRIGKLEAVAEAAWAMVAVRAEIARAVIAEIDGKGTIDQLKVFEALDSAWQALRDALDESEAAT